MKDISFSHFFLLNVMRSLDYGTKVYRENIEIAWGK